MFTRVLLVSLALLGAVPAAFAAEPPPQPEARPGGTPQYLDQGWTEAVRDAYYFTAQGSEILPYDWFIAIEQPYNDKLFCEPDHLAHFNFLPYPKSKANPDGLPIGFVKGKGSQGIEWFGLSCAACHTGQVTYKGQTVRVDGGATLADVLLFQTEIVEAMRATLHEKGKLERFAKRVLGAGVTQAGIDALYTRIHDVLFMASSWEGRSRAIQRHGYGSWDAINVLMNTINATALSEPSNNRTPQNPVSFPSIWLSTQVDWLLWNASIQNSMVRAVGEVIIVFGKAAVTVTKTGLDFTSSADVTKLYEMYETLGNLNPPKWPESVLGAIDQKRAAAGAKIYAREACAKCHHEKPPYPMTPKDSAGNQYIQIPRTPMAEVGTDPVYASYFLQRTAVPSIMAPAFKGTALEGQQNVPAALLFLATLTATTAAQVDRAAKTEAERQKLLVYRPLPQLPKDGPELDALVKSLSGYKCGPLAGIWSTAPYLHNGSVPTLHDLLLPPDKRPKTFTVGSHEYDPVKVGYVTTPYEKGTLFDTTFFAQSNAGHTYGTQITEEERLALLEYLKTF